MDGAVEGAGVVTTREAADARRVAAIEAYDVLDGPPRREIVALVDLAARAAGVDHAMVNLFTEHVQHSVATVGLGEDSPTMESSRDEAICRLTLESEQPAYVADARGDARYSDNTFVEAGIIRFYASVPLRTPAGVVVGTLCVYQDEARPVTREVAESLSMLADRVVDVLELELASRRLTEVNERLERSNERLDAFAGQVSHDLKNPLTSVSLCLELLETEIDVDSEAQGTIARARRASARMDELIDHLLEFAATGGTPRQERVDLGAEVAAVIDDMSSRLDPAHVVVGELPQVTGDRSQLRSVMQNLIHNATKFSAPGQVPDIAVSAVRTGGAHRIEVADRGPGIAPEHREHVFSPLARLDRRIPGFGIGLATSRRIVEAHGGRIGVDAREGGGSVFWLVIPTGPTGTGQG